MGVKLDDVLRIGSVAKVHPDLDSIRLDKLTQNQKSTTLRPKRIWKTWDKIRKAQADVEALIWRLEHLKSSGSLLRYLYYVKPEWYAKFEVPKQHDGFQMVGRHNRPLQDSDLFDDWRDGKMYNELLMALGKNSRNDIDAWSFCVEERIRLIDEWGRDLLVKLADDIHSAASKFNEGMADIRSMKVVDKVDALEPVQDEKTSRRRIIGCTTSGAAKNREFLEMICPGVLIVEEAGEILEAHVLTSLSSKAKHLIMIGDHQQLRPKVQQYRLQVESGRGYNLNMSLFERLVLTGYPCSKLSTQHRMHPDISRLVREVTYPELMDASDLEANRAAVKGLQGRVIFIDHRHPDSTLEARQRNEENGASKSNEWQAKMVVATALYLLQQGYSTDDLVILTPYLGQLMLIRDVMVKTKHLRPDLSEADIADLLREGDKLTPELQQPADLRKAIRIATVDNYQGEEANIVLISLVRSNKGGDIGFVGQPERANVLLSRARQGEIIFGNLETFRSSKKVDSRDLWTKIEGLLREKKCIYTGLPIICQRHRDKCNIVDDHLDFARLAPRGGCLIVCQAKLPCGHDCFLQCHLDQSHSNIRCKENVTVNCSNGHPITFPCVERAERQYCKTCIHIGKEEEKRKKLAAKVAQDAVAEYMQVKGTEEEKRKKLAAINALAEKNLELFYGTANQNITVEAGSQRNGSLGADGCVEPKTHTNSLHGKKQEQQLKPSHLLPPKPKLLSSVTAVSSTANTTPVPTTVSPPVPTTWPPPPVDLDFQPYSSLDRELKMLNSRLKVSEMTAKFENRVGSGSKQEKGFE